MSEVCAMDAAALAAAFHAGTLSPVQALDACLARIAERNPALNAFVALRAEGARAEAQASAERHAAGTPRSPLDGVPIAIKDNLPTADLPTTWGSVAGRDDRPARDELAVARARAAGLVIVGKTNVPEFTLEGYTHNALFGTTGNPWNPALTPGGSSGGSVAAVASGMVPLALGTDGGGSTRRPCGYTGLVGLKPSIGAIAREHALPPLLLDFEVVGPIARTVADLQLLFGVLAGPHAADPASFAAAGAARTLPERLRVLYVPTLDGAPVDPGIAAACEAGAMRLQALGHTVTTGPLPLDLAALNAGWPRIGQIGLSWLFEHHPHWREGAADKTLAMAEEGAKLPGHVLWQTLESATQLRRDAAHLFERVDLIAMPSSAAMPWPADQPFPPTIAGQPVGPRGHAIFTGWVNAAGLPALNVPVEPVEGLPVGLQLIGPFGADRALLALGQVLEPAFGGLDQAGHGVAP
ncbi:MAG: amidase [Burkholderiaceae bacterium]|nr:amidase [Burkholderiaceae bacterium]